MDSERASIAVGASGKNKPVRDQDKRGRRYVTKSVSHDRGGSGGSGVNQTPVFGRPVEKKDSELHKITLDVLGDYNSYKTAMEWGKQTNYFGVADATPSTPIQTSKFSPFDNEFRAASSRGVPSSSSGASSSSIKTTLRHQVAELPASQQYHSKKDKTRTKPHLKHSSKGADAMVAGGGSSQRAPPSLATSSVKSSNKDREMKKSSSSINAITVRTPAALVENSGEAMTSSSQQPPTNVLRSKPKKVRPHRPQVTGSHTSTNNTSSSSSTLSTTSSSAQSKSNPQSNSLFDFSTPTIGGSGGATTSNGSLSVQRTTSSGVLSTSASSSFSSKSRVLTKSDSAHSFTSIPSSRQSESHMTSNQSNVVSHHHKHSKKLVSIPPNVGSSPQKSTESMTRVVSIKRTSSLEFVKQVPPPQHPSSEKDASNETQLSAAPGEMNKSESGSVLSQNVIEKSSSKKKVKKIRKKSKKDKLDVEAILAEKKISTSSVTTTAASSAPPSSLTVVSAIGHVNTTGSHVTTQSSTHVVKTESTVTTRSRPSDLKITAAGQVGGATTTGEKTGADLTVGMANIDDMSHDAGDVRSMLQEMMKPLDSYSLVTPIPTPVKTRPFVFPTKQSSGSDLGSSEQDVFNRSFSKTDTSQESMMQVGGMSTGRSRNLSTSSSDGESDADNKMAVDLAMSTLDFNLAEEHVQPEVSSQPPPSLQQHDHHHRHQRPPPSPTLSVSSSSSSSGESSSESSDSSSEGEGEGEGEGDESESNITPTLEKLHRHTQLSGAAITPLKKTPPRVGIESFLSPLADESANLSPAKPVVRISSSTVQSHSDNSMLMSQASMGFNPIPVTSSPPSSLPPTAAAPPLSYSSDSDSGSESDSESSDSEDQSSGEEDNTVEMDLLEAGHGQLKRASIQSSEEATPAPPFGSSTGFWDEAYDLMSVASELGDNQSKVLSGGEMQPFTDDQMDTGGNNATAPVGQSNGQKQSKVGKKRKHNNSESEFSLRKVHKLMNKVQMSSDLEDGECLSNMNPPRILATGGNGDPDGSANVLHSSLSGSDESDNDEEEGEIPSDGEDGTNRPPSRQQGIQPAATAAEGVQENMASSNSLWSNQGGATSSSKLASNNMEGAEEDEQVHSLMVSFQLSSIPKLPLQKPKATVEPFYHRSTSTSKVAKRRNTVDAPGERDGDEVQSRGLSRERGERSMYNRHREEYGREYHRPPRSHRDSSARWDRESSRDRRMYGSSEERSGRHGGGGRHGSGWDRDYHGDDYWNDGGGTHYDRGSTREYDRGSRQRGDPERKRGAEYFMQEARRRKHEADKIPIPGVDKAKAYMESVPFFLRHGDAIEHERQQQNQQWVESGGEALKRKSFKMYSDTLSVVRFCQNMAGDCKPLVVVCLRCQSILLWRMFQLKQATSSHAQKELQEFFVLPKGTQSKSPYPNNFSPLPSPASVSSTASNGSGGGAFPQDPSPSCTVSVPKHIFNKTSEHLAIASYVHQSFDAWRKADSMMDQCREFFVKAERKCSRLHQFSASISQAASWVENMLRNLR